MGVLVGNLKKGKDFIDAITYIRNSTMYSHERYKWLRPLIDKVLSDDLRRNDIKDHLNNILLIKQEKPNKKVIDAKTETQKIPDKNIILSGIKQIKSILDISNVGLIESSGSIDLNNGLNVFYGKNGSGKSSVYFALCNALGFSRNIFPNINKENGDCKCSILIENSMAKEETIKWKRGEINQRRNIKLFDSEISQFLVEKDQVNRFELAHLNAEYFSFLHQLFDDVSVYLQIKLDDVNSDLRCNKELLESQFPLFFSEEYKINDEQFLKISFTDEDLKNLNIIEAKIEALEKQDVSAIIKNLKTAQNNIISILEIFGELYYDEKSEGEEKEIKWIFKYTNTYFEDLDHSIEEYNKAKEAFEESGSEKLAKLIPENWIKLEKWNEFIKSSILFLRSLDNDQKDKYLDEVCVYCQQPLQTEEAKRLMKIYYQIQEEHETKLREIESSIKKSVDDIVSMISFLQTLPEKNINIESEFHSIGKSGKIEVSKEELNEILSGIKKKIDAFEKTSVSADCLIVIQQFWDLYIELYEDFEKAIKDLSEALIDKQKRIGDLKNQALPIQCKRDCQKSKENIIKYFYFEKLVENLSSKLSDVSTVKQASNTLATRFSQEIPLEIFKQNLIEEYKNFNFKPPNVWHLTSITRGEDNKRVYSLKDKRLSEIFSEGERKIHALADFFALCSTNDYKGVFIFDDPVNSLDEENIEVVSQRILQLVNEGNQVIVFTHNLFFLYSLIEHNYDKEKITKLNRLSESIYMEKGVLIGRNHELKKIFQEIEKRMESLSDKDEKAISEYELREIYNLMSGYLETFVEVHLFKEIITRYRPNIRMNSLNRINENDFLIIGDLVDFYNKTSRKGSRHSHPVPTPPPKYQDLLPDFQNLQENYNFS